MWVISWWLFLIFKKKNAIFSYYIHTNGILEVMKNWGSRSTLTRDFTNLLLSAASTDLLNINNGNTRTMSETFSKLTTRTPEDITDIVLMCLLITLNRYHYYLGVSIADFE